MKVCLITNNLDVQTGFRFVGVDCIVISEQNPFEQALNNAIKDTNIGIVLVTERDAEKNLDLINDIRLNKKMPLVAIIPDSHGSVRDKNFISNYVREAIGVKLN